jgi:hypothetical protein
MIDEGEINRKDDAIVVMKIISGESTELRENLGKEAVLARSSTDFQSLGLSCTWIGL